jgi:putative SOS response-associated peptidase YedK
VCGRYYTRSQKQEIAQRMKAGTVFEEPLAPDFNIAPTTFQPVVRMERDADEREMVLARWGLVPFFAKSLAAFRFSTFNAKAETLAKSATWRTPLRKRRWGNCCPWPFDAGRARDAVRTGETPRGPILWADFGQLVGSGIPTMS